MRPIRLSAARPTSITISPYRHSDWSPSRLRCDASDRPRAGSRARAAPPRRKRLASTAPVGLPQIDVHGDAPAGLRARSPRSSHARAVAAGAGPLAHAGTRSPTAGPPRRSAAGRARTARTPGAGRSRSRRSRDRSRAAARARPPGHLHERRRAVAEPRQGAPRVRLGPTHRAPEPRRPEEPPIGAERAEHRMPHVGRRERQALVAHVDRRRRARRAPRATRRRARRIERRARAPAADPRRPPPPARSRRSRADRGRTAENRRMPTAFSSDGRIRRHAVRRHPLEAHAVRPLRRGKRPLDVEAVAARRAPALVMATILRPRRRVEHRKPHVVGGVPFRIRDLGADGALGRQRQRERHLERSFPPLSSPARSPRCASVQRQRHARRPRHWRRRCARWRPSPVLAAVPATRAAGCPAARRRPVPPLRCPAASGSALPSIHPFCCRSDTTTGVRRGLPAGRPLR